MTSPVHTKQPYGFKDMIGHFIAVYLISAAVVGAVNALCWYFFGTYALITLAIFPLFFAGLFWGFRSEKKLGRNPPFLMRLKFLIFTCPISAVSLALWVWYCATFDPSTLDPIRGVLLANSLLSWTAIISFTVLFHLSIVLSSFRYSAIDYPDHEYWTRLSYKWGVDKMSKTTVWTIIALLYITAGFLIYL